MKPITANKMWQGRRFKTPEYKAWRESFNILVPKREKHCFADKTLVEVDITLYLNLRSFKISDVDNYAKPILDALVESEVLDDDRYVNTLRITKMLTEEEEHITIYIKKYVQVMREVSDRNTRRFPKPPVLEVLR